ncbi:MAG: metal-dependent transcriptional regulator [Fibrobacteria bacterium]|nr:metal-dependent transcriptional regulator [Fibrobacteria bacterium]
MPKKKYSASVEDYLEAIHEIIAKKQAVRAKDIAAWLGVSNPSVSGALKHIANLGLINYVPYDVITLTPLGEKTAHEVIKKHATLTAFFTDLLALSPEEADEEACKVEHVISGKLLQRLIGILDHVKNDPTFSKCVNRLHQKFS